jgi:hypothetical protein
VSGTVTASRIGRKRGMGKGGGSESRWLRVETFLHRTGWRCSQLSAPQLSTGSVAWARSRRPAGHPVSSVRIRRTPRRAATLWFCSIRNCFRRAQEPARERVPRGRRLACAFGWAVRSARGKTSPIERFDLPPAERPAHPGPECPESEMRPIADTIVSATPPQDAR